MLKHPTDLKIGKRGRELRTGMERSYMGSLRERQKICLASLEIG